MYLMHKPGGDLIGVLSLDRLFDPFRKAVNGRLHADEECKEPTAFGKGNLVFPSGEYLPRCRVDPAYMTKLHGTGG